MGLKHIYYKSVSQPLV